MVDQAQTMMDEKKRLEIYHRINKLWIDDVAAVPLYQQVDLYGANTPAGLEGPQRRGDQGVRHVAEGREIGGAGGEPPRCRTAARGALTSAGPPLE